MHPACSSYGVLLTEAARCVKKRHRGHPDGEPADALALYFVRMIWGDRKDFSIARCKSGLFDEQ
jgi:hypothetical protein